MLKNSPLSRQRIYKLHYIDFILDLILGDYFSGKNNLNNIERIVSQVILLPCYPKYSDEEIEKNIYLIKKFFSN